MLVLKRFILIALMIPLLMLSGYQCYLIVNATPPVDNEVKYAQLVDQYQLLKMQRLVRQEQTLAMVRVQAENKIVSKVEPILPKTTQVALSLSETKTFETLEAYVNDSAPIKTPSLTPDEKQILAAPADDYTLQLMGVRDATELKRFIQEKNLSDAAIIHTYYLNKDWYVLTYGRYHTHNEAVKAIEMMPAELQQLKPWVRQLVSVQKAIQLFR